MPNSKVGDSNLITAILYLKISGNELHIVNVDYVILSHIHNFLASGVFEVKRMMRWMCSSPAAM